MTKGVRIKHVDRERYSYILDEIHGYLFDFKPMKGGELWLAWVEGKRTREVVGFASLHFTSTGRGYLSRAGVLRSFRGMGLQRRLIRAREAFARKRGVECVVTDTTDNIWSANNLIRSGYSLFEPEKRWAFKRSLYWWRAL